MITKFAKLGTALLLLLGSNSFASATNAAETRVELGDGFMVLSITDAKGAARSLYENLDVPEQATGLDGGASYLRVGKRITCYKNLGNSSNYSCVQIVKMDGDIHN